MITWTIGAYTVTWDGSGKVTVTITATSQFVLSYAASTFQAAVSAPELTAILQPLPFSSNGLQLVATTGVAGFALQNATPTILSWTAPADGNMHRVVVLSSQSASGTAAGGNVALTVTAPDGTVGTPEIYGGSPGNGFHNASFVTYTIQPGSAFIIRQSAALTAGSVKLFAEIWGS